LDKLIIDNLETLQRIIKIFQNYYQEKNDKNLEEIVSDLEALSKKIERYHHI